MKNDKLKEDMLAPADSPAFTQSPIHQVPATASPGDNIDTFALAGPGKSKTTGKSDSKKDNKKRSKKEDTSFPSNKVLTFEDFMNQRSTK